MMVRPSLDAPTKVPMVVLVSFFVLSFRVPASRDFAYVSFPSSSIPD